MATIDIRRNHTLSKEAARERAEDLAKTMQERFALTWKWDGDVISFEAPSGAAKGTKGKVTVSPAEVRVEIDLPFLLKMLKGTIEAKIEEKLKTLV